MKQSNQTIKDNNLSKVAFGNVGCEKNLIYTEHIQGLLDRERYQLGNNIEDENNYLGIFVEANICFAYEYDLYREVIKIL